MTSQPQRSSVGGRPRHIPQRTCVACRATSGKREFVRIVRLSDGRVEVDTTGKRSGRGAYLCANQECWQTALQRGQIARALKATIIPADREQLAAFAAGLPVEKPNSTTDGL